MKKDETLIPANETVVRFPVRNDDLAKSLNILRIVPGAPNPFVEQSQRIQKRLIQSEDAAPLFPDLPTI